MEAAGGVERYSRAAQEDTELGESLERADAEQRRLRPELPLGIAGTRSRRTAMPASPTRARMLTGRNRRAA